MCDELPQKGDKEEEPELAAVFLTSKALFFQNEL
jgi:hypothetical protein